MKKRLMAMIMASMFVLSTACGTKQTEGGNDAAANEYAEEEQSAETVVTEETINETSDKEEDINDEDLYADYSDYQLTIPLEKQVEMFAWYTTTDWPVDPRWDEHEDIAKCYDIDADSEDEYNYSGCEQIGDMFFWEGMSYEEFAKEISSSKIKDAMGPANNKLGMILFNVAGNDLKHEYWIDIDNLPQTYDDLYNYIKNEGFECTEDEMDSIFITMYFADVYGWYDEEKTLQLYDYGYWKIIINEQRQVSTIWNRPCDMGNINKSFIRIYKDQKLEPMDWDRILNDREYAEEVTSVSEPEE